MDTRSEFSSRFGFLMAAAGSAVGLGNIWGFPTQTAENGGGAFVLVYLFLTFVLAYPVLMAELLIGRHGRTHIMGSLGKISSGPVSRKASIFISIYALVVVSLILSFYSIVAGWMLTSFLDPVARLLDMNNVATWLTAFSLERNLLAGLTFLVLTVWVINRGVKDGIEAWSSRLMPLMIIIIIGLIGYVMTLDGAEEGLRIFLTPDFSRVLDPELVISALGQAFFSLSLGVGTMMIYGSYVNRKENMVKLGAYVAILDTSIAVLAGLLIIPAMYVAQHNGVSIYAADGSLLSGDTLVFSVLPQLFSSLGSAEIPLSLFFFALLSIAALTSSISMLEVPVAYVSEDSRFHSSRHRAAYLMAIIVAIMVITILFNFESLFGLVIGFTTQISQPLIGILFCIYAGWIWQRNSVLKELAQGNPEVANSLFWRIWPNYIRFVCPILLGLVYWQSLS
jgi:NSS family neurotransmitter:Na+ symporter